jgi:hypothetical protein
VITDAGPADAECWHLVRVFAERVGALVAAATAVVTLTAVGLSRLVVVPDRRRPGPSRAEADIGPQLHRT